MIANSIDTSLRGAGNTVSGLTDHSAFSIYFLVHRVSCTGNLVSDSMNGAHHVSVLSSQFCASSVNIASNTVSEVCSGLTNYSAFSIDFLVHRMSCTGNLVSDSMNGAHHVSVLSGQFCAGSVDVASDCRTSRVPILACSLGCASSVIADASPSIRNSTCQISKRMTCMASGI
jgi:hypothetical protein